MGERKAFPLMLYLLLLGFFYLFTSNMFRSSYGRAFPQGFRV